MPAGVAAGRHIVEVYALDLGDPNRKVLLKSASVEVGAPQVAGSFDAWDFNLIAGWGRAAPNDTAPRFRVDINGVPFQTFPGTPSSEPSEAGMNLLRFALPTPPLGVSVSNTVTLYYIDPITREPILLATRTVPTLQATTGTVDVANTSIVRGWAWSPTLPNAVINVQLLIDNVEVAVSTASLDRPDLTGTLAGHAYQFTVPSLAPGQHIFAVRFRDPVTGDYSLVATPVRVTV
jgi:hypothetical protein